MKLDSPVLNYNLWQSAKIKCVIKGMYLHLNEKLELFPCESKVDEIFNERW